MGYLGSGPQLLPHNAQIPILLLKKRTKVLADWYRKQTERKDTTGRRRRRMRKQLSSLAGVPGLVDDANASEIPAHKVRLQGYAETISFF
jgi:hypothetical protein